MRNPYKLEQELNLAGEACTGALEAHTGRSPNSWATPARLMVGRYHHANPRGKATAPAQRGPRRPASTPCLRTGPTTPHPVGERRASRRGPGPGMRRLAVVREWSQQSRRSRPESGEASSVARPLPWEQHLPWVGQRGPCRVSGGPGARAGPGGLQAWNK